MRGLLLGVGGARLIIRRPPGPARGRTLAAMDAPCFCPAANRDIFLSVSALRTPRFQGFVSSTDRECHRCDVSTAIPLWRTATPAVRGAATNVRPPSARSRAAECARAGVVCLILCRDHPMGVAGYLALESYHIPSTCETHLGTPRPKKEMKRSGEADELHRHHRLYRRERQPLSRREIGGARSMSIGEPRGTSFLYDRDKPEQQSRPTPRLLPLGIPLGWRRGDRLPAPAHLDVLAWKASETSRPARAAGEERFHLACPWTPPSAGGRPSARFRRHTSSRKNPMRGRSGMVRAFCGRSGWSCSSYPARSVIAAARSPCGGRGRPRRCKELAEQVGATVGPWVMLRSTMLAVVMGFMGLLPGTGRGKRCRASRLWVPEGTVPPSRASFPLHTQIYACRALLAFPLLALTCRLTSRGEEVCPA